MNTNKFCTSRRLTTAMMIGLVLAIVSSSEKSSTPSPQPVRSPATESAEPHGRLDSPTVLPGATEEFGVAVLDIQPVLVGTELAVTDLLGR